MPGRLGLATTVMGTVATGLLVLALTSAGPLECRSAAGCDCETAASAGIRQPINAWSSLALGVGAVVLARRPVRRAAPGLAAAVAAAAAAAFVYHSTLTGWAAAAESAAVMMIAGILAAGAWRDRIPYPIGLTAVALVAAASQVIGGAVPNAVTAAFVIGFVLGHVGSGRYGDPRFALAAVLLLAGGGAVWVLSGTDGPWCRPESFVQGHGVWHLAAAAALVALGEYLRSAQPADASTLGIGMHAQGPP